MLRAASDDVVPHSHTDQLVAKLARLCGDEVVPDSDHMNIPYLEATQSRIASFLTARFAMPIAVPSVADVTPAAVLAADTSAIAIAAPRLPASPLLPIFPLGAK